MKVFVAGATGVLGRELVPQLVAQGHEVVGMTRTPSKQAGLRAWARGRSSPTGAGGGELVRLPDATDQLGMVQRIDAGPPHGALAFDVIVWVCSRWREQGPTEERHVPSPSRRWPPISAGEREEARRPSSPGPSTR